MDPGRSQTKLLQILNGDRRVYCGYHRVEMTQPPDQTEIERLLTECEAALAAEDWGQLASLARAVLVLDPAHEAARNLLSMATRELSSQPPSLPRPMSLPIPPPPLRREPAAPSTPADQPEPSSADDDELSETDPIERVESAPTEPVETEVAAPPRLVPPTPPTPARPPADPEGTDLEGLLNRASAAAAGGQWRAAQRFAQAALALDPDRIDAQRLLRDAERGLSDESLAAIRAAARLRSQQEQSGGRRRFGLPSFTIQSLRRPRADRSDAGETSEPQVRRRRAVGVLPSMPSRVLIPAASVLLFFLFASIAFGAFQLMGGGGDGGGGDALVSSGGTSGAGVGGAAGPPPTATPTEETTAEPTATPEPGVAPVIDAVTCRLLDDETSVECTTEVSGDPDELLWSAPGGDPSTGTGERFRTALAAGGPYRVQLEACQRDACSAAESRAFVIGETDDDDDETPTAGPPTEDEPAIASLTCVPETLLAGDSAVCSGSFRGGDVETYDWTVSGVLVGSSSTLNREFLTAGARTVTLQVCNEGGCDTESVTVIVQAPPDPEPPLINVIGCSPLAVQVGESVDCSPTVTGEVDSYEWSAGAETSSLSTFATSYDEAGTQTIALEVCNEDGCDSAEASIDVSVAPPVGSPELALSATLLDFGAVQSQLAVEGLNEGTQPLEWSVGGGASWIGLGLNQSGVLESGENDSFVVSVSRAALTSGAHDGSISVSSNGGAAVLTVSLWKNDVIDPVVTAPGDIEIFVPFDQLALSSADSEVVAWLDGASAIDDLDGVLAVTNLAPVDFPIGPTLVTFIAEDEAGNIGADTATLTVSLLP